jgi:hypothetical protein
MFTVLINDLFGSGSSVDWLEPFSTPVSRCNSFVGEFFAESRKMK